MSNPQPLDKQGKETEQIGIRIGGIADPIYKQLRKQGIKVSSSDVAHFQRAHNGFVQLRILGCMGDKEADRIGQRLVGKIGSFCKQFKNRQNNE